MSKKKRKGSSAKNFILSLFAIILVFAAIAAFFKIKPHFRSITDSFDNDVKMQQIATQLVLDTELVNVNCMGNIAKIDIITPGLDTCSMRIALYDLKSDTVLSETELEDGAWITGQTSGGFYAAEQLSKSLYLYDKLGEVKFKKVFSDSKEWSQVCAVSEDEKYFVYTDLQDGAVFAYNLETEKQIKLAEDTYLRESLGFYNGILYAVGMDSDVAAIDIDNSSVYTEVCDKRLNTFGPFYSLGTTEYSFIAAAKSGTKYIPLSSVDELVVGIGENGFVTTVSNPDGETIRMYDLNKKEQSQVYINDTVESVCYTEGGNIIAVAGDHASKSHKLYYCNTSSLKPETLTINDKDIPKKEEPEITVKSAQPKSKATVISDVPLISQFPEFPTGCESVSAVMVLKFSGENISAEKFIDEYLPKSSEFYNEGGKRFGPSPYEFFIGNPKTASSYGCMAPVIEKAICKFFGNNDRVQNTTGTDLSVLCSEYIDKGIPVMIWATINMKETNPKNSWYLSDGKRFSWPGNEHCMVLIGYDSDSYYFNDPYAGKTVKHSKETTNDRYAELGMQSIVVLKKQ